ncbi:MAG: tetratricopeptide repeat protein [Candidatus Methylomirabilia bacterium]
MPALLVVLCLVIFVPGLPNEFVWDDEQYLTRNPAVAGGLTEQNLQWALTTFHAGNWHPLTWLSHQVDVEVFGMNPAGHHLTSLLLHCANAILFFLAFRRMTGSFWGSALVAALFAVHPLHVESVAWAAERKDVLSTLPWLLALIAWIGWCRKPRPGKYVAVVSLYALSLSAKQMPVTFPFLLLLLDWWPLGRFVPGRRLRTIVEKLPLLALAAAACAVAYIAQSGFGAVGGAPLEARLANAVISYCSYIGKALWPTHLALLYPFPLEPPALLPTSLAVTALTAASIFVLRARRNRPFLAVGWFWFLGTLVPVIGIVQIGNQALADRYTYVPLTGLFIMAIWGIDSLTVDHGRRTPWIASATIILVALLAVTSGAQVRTWHDPVSAFGNAIRAREKNHIAHYNLGVYYHDHGDDRLAIEHFRAAIAIWPGDAMAHNNLALILESEGKVAEAIGELWAATRADPDLAQSHYNLGRLLADSGERFIAQATLERALKLLPAYPEAHARLGELLARQGLTREALPHFLEAVRLSPETALYRSDLGAALAELGRLEEAVESLQEALRLDPQLRVGRENLDKALVQRASEAAGSVGRGGGR